MNVVLDTNVLISALVFKGACAYIYLCIEDRTITPCFTPSTLREFRAVLERDKFKRELDELELSPNEIIDSVLPYSIIAVEPTETITVISDDPSDNYFLACALATGANYIISGDRHLLALKKFADVSICTPAIFLRVIKAKQ